jgi:hypothetical protein
MIFRTHGDSATTSLSLPTSTHHNLKSADIKGLLTYDSEGQPSIAGEWGSRRQHGSKALETHAEFKVR